MLRHLLLVLALLVVSSTSDAGSCFVDHVMTGPPAAHTKRCKLSVLEFDGQASLADTGRNTVVTSLLDSYDLVARKRWRTAFIDAMWITFEDAHGPRRWQQAAKQSGVDAVIEGWVQDEGRRHTLNVTVREASTGNEIDTVTVRENDKGVVLEAVKLKADLDDVLSWCKERTTSQIAE